MKSLTIGWLLAGLLAGTCHGVAGAAMAGGVVAVGADRFVSKGENLQRLLDRTGVLRLGPDTDYRGLLAKPLRVPSGARILARWNARLPLLEIPAGAHDIHIEGLDGNGGESPDIEFLGGEPTRDVTIIGGNGGRIGIAEIGRAHVCTPVTQ